MNHNININAIKQEWKCYVEWVGSGRTFIIFNTVTKRGDTINVVLNIIFYCCCYAECVLYFSSLVCFRQKECIYALILLLFLIIRTLQEWLINWKYNNSNICRNSKRVEKLAYGLFHLNYDVYN